MLLSIIEEHCNMWCKCWNRGSHHKTADSPQSTLSCSSQSPKNKMDILEQMSYTVLSKRMSKFRRPNTALGEGNIDNITCMGSLGREVMYRLCQSL